MFLCNDRHTKKVTKNIYDIKPLIKILLSTFNGLLSKWYSVLVFNQIQIREKNLTDGGIWKVTNWFLILLIHSTLCDICGMKLCWKALPFIFWIVFIKCSKFTKFVSYFIRKRSNEWIFIIIDTHSRQYFYYRTDKINL